MMGGSPSGERAVVEFGDYLGFSAIVVAIFLAIAVQVWQSSRSDARIEKLDTRIDQQIESLRADIKENGKRVSDSELEQARLNGVNSVLVGQTHSHEVGG